MGCQTVSRSCRGKNIYRNRSRNHWKIYKVMPTYEKSARIVVKSNALCSAFGKKLHRRLSVYRLGNIKNYKMHIQAELSAPERARADLSQPQNIAETAAKCSKWSIRHGRLQSEVQIVDSDDRKRKLLRSSLSWNSSPNILFLLTDTPWAVSQL